MAGDKQNPFLAHLIGLYLQAETDIINELVRLRQLGLVDYHAEAALQRVQGILDKMQSESFVYIPQMIEREFYVHHPEARNVPEAVAKHQAGYANALAMGRAAVIDQLAAGAQADILQAGQTVRQTLQNALVGRREPDAFAQIGRAVTAYNQVRGLDSLNSVEDFVAALQQQGICAFVDKAGRRWSLHAYCSMAMRTTRRQAEIAAVLTADPEQDLYKISSHSTTCPLCAPYEGRVYSRSGLDPDFPPLAAAFGKVDPNGPEDLSNSWLNIHPNCLHMLLPWTDAGMTQEEIAKIKEFSSFASNPPSVDPRTNKQRRLYQEQQRAKRRELDAYKQWERYRLALGDKVPKSWETFARHKKAADEVYQNWVREYREAKRLEKYAKVRYNDDGTVVVTDRWTKHRSMPMRYYPNAVVETQFEGNQINRTFYNSEGLMVRQVHSGDHGNSAQHKLGIHGEHAHDFFYDEKGKMIDRTSRELTEIERKENADIL